MEKIALLGLGTMGSGMGQNLLKTNFSLTVYNRTASKAQLLHSRGAKVAGSPAEAVQEADVVLSMLADDEASRAIWLGENGALQASKKASVLIECGTVTPAWIEELFSAASKRGSALLDAPVTGSRTQAEAGELTFLVGGSEAELERARPILEAMGKKVVHVGPSGSGSRLKLINNFLCGVQLASLAEAIGWIERSGLNQEVAIEALCTGAPGSPMLKTMSQRMLSRDYRVNFLLRLLEKDLRYAQKDAQRSDIPLHTAEVPIQLLKQARNLGFGEEDMSSVIEQFRSGREFGSHGMRSS
ncbi:MAG TPA: NAD(P)-dependent oxidoreductase [Edaphobacter sp.]|jgi:3-hydroxyisobutyrate dehydrogenase|nr:NAD(P)-dependent oxidoreductase [Edaphobacter sp.]